MNIAQVVKYKNKQQFYDGAQNRHTKYKNWSWQNTKSDILNTKTDQDRKQNRHEHY